MSIKVCHFTSTHKPKDQRIFYKECASLTKAGYDVTLVEQGSSEECEGVHILGTGEIKEGRWYRLLIRPFSVYRLAKNVDADIYQFHDFELLPFGMLLKKQGKKVIFDCHEDYATRFADSDALKGPATLKKLLKKIYCSYEKHVVRNLDAVVSVTPHICDRLKKTNPNVYMITNYPILNVSNWGKETKYNKESNYIIFAGQISDAYCVTTLTKAVQSIPEIRLKICGPERKKGDIEKVYKEDINRKVDYLGNVPYMKLHELISNSRAASSLVRYSSNHGGKLGTLGVNKFFEAMVCGVPIICTDFKLWKEIIGEYNCGICVNPNNVEEITSAITKLLDDPECAEELGKNGRRAVEEEYNWTTQEAKLLELYKSLEEKN